MNFYPGSDSLNMTRTSPSSINTKEQLSLRLRSREEEMILTPITMMTPLKDLKPRISLLYLFVTRERYWRE